MDTRSLRPLAPGEAVGVMALSGAVDGRSLKRGLERLRAWGHPVVEAPNLRRRAGYLAGSDEERLAGLHHLLERGVRVILAARGGYGVTRLLPRLPWPQMAALGVTFVGFSDLTGLFERALVQGCGVQVHGPMVAAGLARGRNESRLRRLLRGELCGDTLFRFGSSQVVRAGTVVGRSAAFNLSLLCALLGTPWQPELTGAVVFLEEVAEPLYRLDRMLTQIRASGTFSGVKALMSGSLHRCKPAVHSASAWRRLLLETVPHDAVVVDGLPFGHQASNMAFPIGVPVEVDTRRGRVSWSV